MARPSTARTLPELALAALALAAARPAAPQPFQPSTGPGAIPPVIVRLPAARAKSATSVEEALWARQAMASASAAPLALADVAQLLWAAQGQTGEHGRRAAPSAGATYPIEVSVVAGAVTGLPPGVYRYRSGPHGLARLVTGDRRREVADACGIPAMAGAAAIFVVAGVDVRSAARFAERAPRFTALEAGAVCQDLVLEAVALGLGSAEAVEFDGAKLAAAAGALPGETPLAVIPVARPEPKPKR